MKMHEKAGEKIRQIAIGTLLLFLCVVWTAAVRTQASQEFPDLSRTGSITVALRSNGTPVPGGELAVYKVAEAVVDNGFHYAYTDAFQNFGTATLTAKYSDSTNTAYLAEDVFPADTDATSLSNVAANQALAADLASYITTGENAIAPLGTLALGTGSSEDAAAVGTGTFSGPDSAGITAGLYLFLQSEPADGYQPVSPFLVTLPRLVDGAYVYNVDAYPKPGTLTNIEEVPQACPAIVKQVLTSGLRPELKTDLAAGTYFTFEFKALGKGSGSSSECPMPLNAQGLVEDGGPVVSQSGDTMQLRVDGNGTVQVGTITFTSEGEYYYQCREIPGSDTVHFGYDESVYWLKYTVAPNADHTALEVTETLMRSGSAEGEQLYPADGVDEAVFSFNNSWYDEDPGGNKGGNDPTEKPTEPESQTDPKGGKHTESESESKPNGGGNSGGGSNSGGGGNSGGGTPVSSGGGSLPQTGQLWWPIWVLIGAGILLIVAGTISRRRR